MNRDVGSMGSALLAERRPQRHVSSRCWAVCGTQTARSWRVKVMWVTELNSVGFFFSLIKSSPKYVRIVKQGNVDENKSQKVVTL